MKDSEKIEKARNMFERFLSLVRVYDISAYDLFADDAEVTSTRRGMMTIRWKGKNFRELIGPSVEISRKAGITYEVRDLNFSGR